MTPSDFLHNAIVHGAIFGALSAAAVDYDAFRKWGDWNAVKSYSWGVAAWRWAQGAVVGAIAAAGLGQVL